MFTFSQAFSGFSVSDLAETKKFYGQVLGLEVIEEPDMGLRIKLSNNDEIFAYPKDNHTPATFTVLNFMVTNLDEAVAELTAQGVQMERYPGFEHDDKGIVRSSISGMKLDIAWFTDPSGNIIAVMQEK